MKHTLFLSSVLALVSLYSPLYSARQEASGWWDYCLGNTVPYERFAQWLGDIDAPSRLAARKYIALKKYASVLDVPSGLCIDYFGFKKDHISTAYQGLDFSTKLVSLAQRNGIQVTLGDIEQMPFEDNSFDLVYCRHILEHLTYYEQAIKEAIRVAKKEVLIVFFIKPHEKDDIIDKSVLDGHTVYHNTYSQNKFARYVLSHEKVDRIVWENVNDKENIAHIILKK